MSLDINLLNLTGVFRVCKEETRPVKDGKSQKEKENVKEDQDVLLFRNTCSQ